VAADPRWAARQAVTPAQVHLFTVISWTLLALDALVGLVVLRGRWRKATAADRLPPPAGAVPAVDARREEHR
jgi:hypothetical protein